MGWSQEQPLLWLLLRAQRWGGGVGTTRRRAGVMEGFPPRPSEQGLYPRDS